MIVGAEVAPSEAPSPNSVILMASPGFCGNARPVADVPAVREMQSSPERPEASSAKPIPASGIANDVWTMGPAT